LYSWIRFTWTSNSDLGQLHLPLSLGRVPPLSEGGIPGQGPKRLQAGQIGDPARSHGTRDDLGQLGIALQEPPALGDPVGLVAELGRPQPVEFGEDAGLEQLGVQPGHAVDGVAAHDGQMGHSHAPVTVLIDERQPTRGRVVRAEPLAREREEPGVDLVEDLEVARQHVPQERDGPPLERFGHDGVVGVAEGARGDVPRIVPGQLLHVHQQAHELGDRQRGVGVVELDRHLVREAIEETEPERAVVHLITFLVAADDVQERGRYEEVLLGQSELPADEDVVVRVEHPADVLGAGPRLDRPDVVALVELVEIELLHGAGPPQPERVDGRGPVPRDRRVKRRGQHVFRLHPLVAETSLLVGEGAYAAVELHPEAVSGPRDLPGVAVAQPAIGHLDLGAVDDPLMKDSVVVAQAVPVTGVAEGGQRIEKARGETAEPTIAEAGVPLRLAEILEAVAQLGQSLGAGVEEPHGDQAVSQRPAHEVFERQVVDALGVLLVVRVLGADPALDEPVAHGQRQSQIGFPVAVHVPR
jgi:hypothetical protein